MFRFSNNDSDNDSDNDNDNEAMKTTMKKPTNAVLLGVLLSLAGCAEAFGPQKTLLSRIDSLTLRSDMMTKGRRVDPIPQVGAFCLSVCLLCSTLLGGDYWC